MRQIGVYRVMARALCCWYALLYPGILFLYYFTFLKNGSYIFESHDKFVSSLHRALTKNKAMSEIF